MIYKLVTVNLSLIRSFLMAPQCKSKEESQKSKNFLILHFQLSIYDIGLGMICVNILMGPGRASTFHVHKTFERAKLNVGKLKISSQKFVQVTKYVEAKFCKRITVTLLKLKGCFLCIKNDLIEIAPFPQGYFHHFFLAFIPKPDDFRG